MTSPCPPKKRLPLDLTAYAKLSADAAGHIRHFHNLSVQPAGDWSRMGSVFPEQEWHDGLRYQLGMMAYAAGLAHYHRLPAIRGPFRRLFERLVAKMLHRDVWGYWYLTSQGGVACNPDLTELRKPWADPVRRENIMYSGHLLLMTTMHAMLFDSDAYEAPGALTFVHDPVYYGLGTEVYAYSRSTLQQAILAEMERERWLGVCCEPNVIFPICNQFPLVAMRYDAVRKGTTAANDEVLRKFADAWRAKGADLGGDGDALPPAGFSVYMVQQDAAVTFGEIGLSAWTGAMINTWNPRLARGLYPQLLAGYLTQKAGGRLNLNAQPVAEAVRRLVREDPSLTHESPEVFARVWSGLAKVKALKPALRPQPPGAADRGREELMPTKPVFGLVLTYVSEVGPAPHLSGLLQHADQIFTRRWHRGGLYYEQSTTNINSGERVIVDEQGEWAFCDTFTGNALVAYARLNVPDGQRAMYERPWTSATLAATPWIDGLAGFEQGVDFLRGLWDAEARAMILTVRSWQGQTALAPVLRGLPAGEYEVYVDGELDRVDVAVDGSIAVELVVGDERERDLVVLLVNES